jgi:thiamine pyrophosphate-dependent acetolactate synthase large subunit-like protein
VNGAQAFLKALVDAGFDACFANPGTSEMPLASSPGRVEAMNETEG